MKKLDLIMVVEDDPAATFVAHNLLKRSDLAEKLVTARNGKQALSFVQQHFGSPDYAHNLPSIILVDINMPIMDGFEFMEKFNLLELNKRPLVVMLSSSNRKEDIERSFQLKADAYFKKPLKIEDINDFLSKAQS